LLAVKVTDGTKDMLLATASGYSIRFPESDVRPMGRATYGVRGITLRPGDRVVSMEELEPECEILSVAARGYGKRTPVDFYRRQTRGGLGIINLKVSDKTGEVIGARYVVPNDGLMLITQEGMIIRMNVAGIRVVGRSSQGVKLMDLEGTDRLVAMAKVVREEEEELEAAPGGDGADGGDGNGGAGLAAGPDAMDTPEIEGEPPAHEPGMAPKELPEDDAPDEDDEPEEPVN
ncbi:MAG: gyrase subunit, partial [Acidobacteriota bacterium]|nr:gyrase subunit [Acidobacteriota bacterium]